jgi:hypothetical protein
VLVTMTRNVRRKTITSASAHTVQRPMAQTSGCDILIAFRRVFDRLGCGMPTGVGVPGGSPRGAPR